MRVARWLFLTFLALYLVTSGGHFYASDDVQKLAVLDAMWQHHDFAIPDGWMHGAGGRRYAWFPLGASLVMLPGWALGKLATLWVPGVPPVYVTRFCVALQNAFFSAGLVSLVYGLARRLGARSGQAVYAAVALGAGSMVWPYAKTAWSEPAAALLLYASLGALNAAGSAARPNRWLLGAGCGLALACSLRQEWLIAAAGATAWWAWQRRETPYWVPLGCLAVPLLAGELANLCYDAVRYGSAFGFPAYTVPQHQHGLLAEGRLSYSLRNIFQYTFSPTQGLPWYSPALLAGFLALPALPKATRAQLAPWLWALLPLALFYMVGWGVSSWAWGLRYTYVFLPALAVCAAWLWRPGRRGLALGLLGLGVAVQLLAIVPDPVDLFEDELARTPNLTIQRLVLMPVHAPLKLALAADPALVAAGWDAWLHGLPPSSGGSPRARRGVLPDVWWLLALLAPVPKAALTAAVGLLCAGLLAAVAGLVKALREVPG